MILYNTSNRLEQATDLGISQSVPLRKDIKLDTINSSIKESPSDQENGEHNVGERGCEIYYLKHTAHPHCILCSCNRVTCD